MDHLEMAKKYHDLALTGEGVSNDGWSITMSDGERALIAANATSELLFAVVERLDTLIGLLTSQDIRITQTSGPVETRCENCGRTGNHRCKGPVDE